MPLAPIDVKITRLGPGVWDVEVYGYFDSVAESNHITDGGAWFEIDESETGTIVVGSTELNQYGWYKCTGIEGSDSDLFKRHLRIWMHYVRPGTDGPEYRVWKLFSLGYNNWGEGQHGNTEVLALSRRASALRLGGLRSPVFPIVSGLALLFLGLKKR